MTTAIATISKEHVPFADQNCKILRFLANVVISAVKAFFNFVIAIISWPFSSSYFQHYLSMAQYHFIKVISFIMAVKNQGDIIDFSINCTTCVKEHIENAVEIDELEKMYGSLESWYQIGTPDIPLNLKQLKRLDMGEGVCFGMSLDFLSHYLQEIEHGKTPEEAIKAISYRYSEGAPDEAQIAHIFYHALEIGQTLHEIKLETDRKIDKYQRDMALWLKEEQEKVQAQIGHANFDVQNAMKNVLLQSNEKFKEFEKQVLTKFLKESVSLILKREDLIAQRMGLACNKTNAFFLKANEREHFENDFHGFVHNLPNGSYKVGLHRGKGFVGHAVIFIKTDEEWFIFDPNFGTQHCLTANDLWKLTEISDWEKALDPENVENIEGFCSLVFSSFDLI